MSKVLIIVIVVAVLLMVALPVAGAQDVTGPGQPVDSDVIAPIDLESGFAIALAALAAILGSSVTSPVTTFLVSLLKRISALDNISSGTLALVVGGTLSGIATIAAAAGRTEQFNSFVDFLKVAGPGFVLLMSTLRGSSAIYNEGRGKTWYGYERPQPSERLRQELGAQG